ncbi:HupE/UreJ family protein [Pelagibacterium halotolerans]|uniref:HupE/UreJ family protein n=1 Tax=Pelagibacterium halotolerans TaxID=531813 RepID=UPI00384CF4C7
MIKRIALAALAVFAATAPAFAHLDPATHGAFAAGFSHPLFGLDHILAMVAVGLWAASIGGRALWTVPLAFVAMMAVGFGAAIAGMPLPFVEPVILASVIFIGIMIALALPIPTVGVSGIVAFFALFHGHAHGGELGAAGALDFALGFILATALLHAAGIAMGVAIAGLMKGAYGRTIMRVAGMLTGLGGLWLAIGG